MFTIIPSPPDTYGAVLAWFSMAELHRAAMLWKRLPGGGGEGGGGLLLSLPSPILELAHPSPCPIYTTESEARFKIVLKAKSVACIGKGRYF